VVRGEAKTGRETTSSCIRLLLGGGYASNQNIFAENHAYSGQKRKRKRRGITVGVGSIAINSP